jgi:hypothetical protein
MQTADGPCSKASLDSFRVIRSDGTFFKGKGD